MHSLSALRPETGRFIHIIPDEKFIDAASEIFEEIAPGAHDYVHFGRPPPFRYLQFCQPLRLPPDQADRSGLTKLLPSYSGVIVHSLNQPAKLMLDASPAKTCACWLAWGADYYHLIRTREELWLPRTRCLLEKMEAIRRQTPWRTRFRLYGHSLSEPIQALTRARMRSKAKHLSEGTPGELELINRFASMSPPLREDHTALITHNPAIKVPFLDWTYMLSELESDARPLQPNGYNILMGNSATPENNHMDTLAILPKKLPTGVSIVCPLSYGKREYGDAIEREGKVRFGDHFVALRTFMSSAAYADVISSCSIVVMNHIRQQALGNILLALCCGARVFLNPASPIFHSMRELRIPVYDTAELPGFLSTVREHVPRSEVQHIRCKIAARWGYSAVRQKTESLLQFLQNQHVR